MAECEKINVEIANHSEHVLRVWHDYETRWFYDVDGTNPRRVSFDFETGLDFEKEREKAKNLAHHAIHQGICQEQLNWKLNESTKSKVLGRKDKG